MKKGFTLVELSIVLVIVGLLTGGILAAQSMAENARIGRGIKQLQQYEIMFMQYRNLYNFFPGDDPVTKNSCSYCYGGNGNGLMGYTYAGWATWGEQFVAWKDLQAVGFLNSDPHYTGVASYSPSVVYNPNITNWVGNILPSFAADKTVAIYPQAYFMPSWGDPTQAIIASQQPQCKTVFALSRYTSGDFYTGGAMNGKMSLALDRKIDDGNGASGLVVATYVSTPALLPAGRECFVEGNVNSYDPAVAKTYNMSSDEYACIIFYCLQDY